MEEPQDMPSDLNRPHPDEPQPTPPQDNQQHDPFSDKTHPSLGQKIKRHSTAWTIFMLVIVLISAAIAYHSFQVSRAWREFSQNCREISPNTYDAANDAQPVYISGEMTTDQVLEDPQFGISIQAIVLQRKVEMYQYKETTSTHKTPDPLHPSKEISTTTYQHRLQWADHHLNCSSNMHKNPPMPTDLPSWKKQSDQAKIGCFELSKTLMAGMDAPFFIMNPAMYEQLPFETRNRYKLHEGYLYLGRDPVNPSWKDIRIQFFAIPTPYTATVFAEQNKQTLVPYHAQNGQTIFYIQQGKIGMYEFLDKSSKLQLGFYIGILIALAALAGMAYFAKTTYVNIGQPKDGQPKIKKRLA